jgi:SAM-dependent methyltransferase
MKVPVNFVNYIQKDNKNLFQTFDQKNLNIDWKTVSILDYGCNVGNYLSSANTVINKENYIGIDINQEAISIAKNRFPEYNFVHYNKWHQAYNPTGDRNIKASHILGNKFDVIILYSVFTHDTLSNLKKELADLTLMLKEDGIIMFTVWNLKIFEPFYKYYQNIHSGVNPIDFSQINCNKVAYWIDNQIVTDTAHIDTDYSSIHTFYNLDYIKAELSMCKYLGVPTGQYQDLFIYHENNNNRTY